MARLFSNYARIPNSDLPSNAAETHRPSSSSTASSGPAFGRARTRWALIVIALLSLLLFFGLISSNSQYADKIGWSHPPPPPTSLEPIQVNGKEMDRWIQGSGRTDLNYNSPFNPEDLTLTEDECDAFFPGLWDEIDRSIKYFTTRKLNTQEWLDQVCDDGIWSHARVLIYNNKLYMKYFQQSAFTRINAALGLLHQSLITGREKLPNVEFCLSANDWASQGKFSLDRPNYVEDVWLMPDYGWFSWPEPGIGSYSELREKTLRVERSLTWEKKISKLFWRGNINVGKADREAMLGIANGYDWNDAKPLDWNNQNEIVPMHDHCKYKFHGFPEGMTYSGRLRYLQNCKVVIITHPPRWIQHWTHLYNADPNSPDQNIVYIPEYDGPEEGILVHDGDKTYKDRTWMRLPEVMDELLKNDEKARRIAENQWSFFRERYVSPASAACYWRKAIKGYASTQRFKVEYMGNETSYETFMLTGNKMKK